MFLPALPDIPDDLSSCIQAFGGPLRTTAVTRLETFWQNTVPTSMQQLPSLPEHSYLHRRFSTIEVSAAMPSCIIGD